MEEWGLDLVDSKSRADPREPALIASADFASKPGMSSLCLSAVTPVEGSSGMFLAYDAASERIIKMFPSIHRAFFINTATASTAA